MEGLPGGTGCLCEELVKEPAQGAGQLFEELVKEPAQGAGQLQRTSIKNEQRTPGITHQHFTFIKTVSSYPVGYCIENLVVLITKNMLTL